jgi:hypothetical protein
MPWLILRNYLYALILNGRNHLWKNGLNMVNWQIVLSQHGFHRTDHEEWLHERWENDRFYPFLSPIN